MTEEEAMNRPTVPELMEQLEKELENLCGTDEVLGDDKGRVAVEKLQKQMEKVRKLMERDEGFEASEGEEGFESI